MAGGFSLGAVGEGREDLQKEISVSIEQQVSRLIEQARLDTESKVKIELKTIRESMIHMDVRLDQLLAQIDGIEPAETTEPSLDAETVGHLLSKIEQQWGQEIRTLKQELHQTILAHNHNADLIKHHKDTIDALRERCMKLQSNSMKTNEIQVQLTRLDTRLKQQQKQRKLEPLFERLAALEQRVAAAATWRYQAAMPPVVAPGMPPGIPTSMMPGLAAAGLMGKTGTGAKGGLVQAAATAAAAGVLSAEATSTPAAAGAGSAALPAKAGEKAAYKCPTDEEVQAHISKLTVAPEAEIAQEAELNKLAAGDEAVPRAEELDGAAAQAGAPVSPSAPASTTEAEET